MSAAPAPPSMAASLRHCWRLLVLARPYHGRLGKGILLGIVASGAGIVTPYLSKLYIDQVYPTRDVSFLLLLVIAAFIITVASAVLSALRGFYATVVMTRLAGASTLHFFNHVQHLPASFFDQHRVGEIMSRFQSIRESLAMIGTVSQLLVLNVAYVFLIPPLLWTLNWRLALLALAGIPITTGISIVSARLSRRLWQESAASAADVSATQFEILSQIRTVKALSAERETCARVRRQTTASIRSQVRAGAVGGVVTAVNAVVAAASTALFTWYAWVLILAGQMTIGGYVAFIGYIALLTGPISQTAGFFSNFQQTAISLQRMFEYLDAVPEQSPERVFEPEPGPRPPLTGDIVFANASLAFEGGGVALRNVSLRVPEGRTLAIVGESGAGKSSLLKLVGRFVTPTSGTVSVGGVTVDAVPLDHLRRQVAVIWQDVTLIRGTLRENVTFGMGSVDDGALADVLRIVQLTETVDAMPQRLDTEVAEGGATLSGGQRQRLALARSLLRDSPYLLLDEVTSQIDVVTEQALLTALFERVRGRTVVFVTHRPATAKLADSICVLRHGEVCGVGTHEDLLAECLPYRAMIESSAALDDVRRLRVLGAS